MSMLQHVVKQGRKNIIRKERTYDALSILYKEIGNGTKDRLAIAIRSLKDRCVTIVSLTQVLV